MSIPEDKRDPSREAAWAQARSLKNEPPAVPSPKTGAFFAQELKTEQEMRRRGRRLFRIELAATIAAMIYFGYNSQAGNAVQIYLGLGIMALSVLPTLLWAKRARYGLPVFEVFMLTGANTYAIPMLAGRQDIGFFGNDVIVSAGFGVILFQVVTILAYTWIPARPKRRPWWTQEVVSGRLSRWLGQGLFVTVLFSYADLFTDWIPYAYEGTIRAACFGLGIVSSFLQSRRWGQNELKKWEKILLVALLGLQAFIGSSALLLVGAISSLLLALLGYFSSSKKIPWILIIVAFPIISLMHLGESTMRQKYWNPDEEVARPTVAELPAFYLEWFNDGIDLQAQKSVSANDKLLERSSLLHLLCLVNFESPDRRPFLNGETYLQTFELFIPRFLWADKPPGNVSTGTLAVYYGLLREADTAKTTIGFGLLAEAYANFGFMGLAAIGFVFGAFFKKITGFSSESPALSYAGLFMMLLMAWSFQSEDTFSLWVNSLSQACVVVFGGAFVAKAFLK